MTTEKNGVPLESPPLKPDPDPILIKRAQQGDRESLKDLLEEISPSVRQWAMAHTGDPDTASDLCQEVFLLLLRKISSYRGEARFLTWLFTVTRNQALEGARRDGRDDKKMTRFKAEMGDFHGAPGPGEAHVDRKRLGKIITAFVHDLPRRQREVFQMSELQGLSSPEIGAILELDPGSVRAALLKARRSLRRKILEKHPEFVEEYLS
jgi:RNA polymerase sigma-70 factor (ECF subfamily)